MSKYQGFSHIFLNNRPVAWLWKRWLCPKEIHLLDETSTAGDDDGWNHYFSCDACEIMIEIGRVSRQYVDPRYRGGSDD